MALHKSKIIPKRYIDILPDLVESYNKSWHTGILSESINVNKNNENKLW